jgi:hypothetical protein
MTNVNRTIVLKTIHNDIIKSNPDSTLTTKQMRTALRKRAAEFAHARHNAWTFTDAERDVVRSMYDPAYAAKIARATKRATSPKRERKSKVVVENVDA